MEMVKDKSNWQYLVFGAVLAGLGSAIGWVSGYYLVEVPKGVHPSGAMGAPVLGLLAGAVISVGGVLLMLAQYTGRFLNIKKVTFERSAGVIGIAWGTVAVLIATGLETVTSRLPGSWGKGDLNNLFPGFIEEGAKLLLPVLFLLFWARYRDPMLGFWVAFVGAAWFGFLEGVGYMFIALTPILHPGQLLAHSDEAWVMFVDVLSRSVVELSHPLITGGAAAIIWLASKRFGGAKAAWIGVAAYVGAALIHTLNDAVIDGVVFKWNVPVSLALLVLYVVAIFFWWFRPQLVRLRASQSESEMGAR